MRKQTGTVDAYILAAPKEVQGKLREVRAAIKAVAPTAKESVSYRMPFYNYNGRLAWFGLHTTHIGLYLRPPVIAGAQERAGEVRDYEVRRPLPS